MTHFQKSLQIALLVLSTLFFSACQTNQNTSNHCQISLSTWGSSQEISLLKPLLSQFERQHPGCQIKLLHIPENYFQKLHILMAGGLAPDVMLVNSINAPVYARHGLFRNLTQQSAAQDYYPNALKALTYEQHVIAFPRDISNLVIFYNRDWLKKAGLPDPHPDWTWPEFLKYAQKLTVDSNHDGRPERFGVSFYAKPPLFWLPFVWSAGGTLFNPDLSQSRLSAPETTAGLSFYSALRNAHHVAPRQMDTGGASMSQLFQQQQVAMLVSGRWSVPVFREQAKFDWDVAPFPTGPSGHSRVGIDASGYAVSATSKHPQEAMALAAFLTAKPAITAFSQDGLIVPARPDVAESTLFLNPNQKPVHSRIFLSVIAEGVPTHLPERWNEIAEELQLGLQPVWDGKASIDDVSSGLSDKIQPLLGGSSQ